jgi:hypothetical protein
VGKSSVKYHLRANHQVEAKRWYWALNNAIQWTKDEDKEEQKRIDRESDALKTAKDDKRRDGDSQSLHGSVRNRLSVPPSQAQQATSSIGDDEDTALSRYTSSVTQATRLHSQAHPDSFDHDEDMGDDASSHEPQPLQKDALNLTAQSLKMQLDLLAQVSSSLNDERKQNPSLTFSDPLAIQAMSAYESAVGNLRGLIGDYLRMASDRDAYWQYRLEQEANMRRMWEESMAKVAQEHEVLESRIGEVEDKRKRTKRALRGALELAGSAPTTPQLESQPSFATASQSLNGPGGVPIRRKTTFNDLAEELSDSDSDQDEEFFDAVDAGEVEVVDLSENVERKAVVPAAVGNLRDQKFEVIKTAFTGYEDGIRKKLKLAADNRPKISLWVSVYNNLETLLTIIRASSKV